MVWVIVYMALYGGWKSGKGELGGSVREESEDEVCWVRRRECRRMRSHERAHREEFIPEFGPCPLVWRPGAQCPFAP